MAQLNEQAKRNINELKNNWAAALDKYYSSDLTGWKMERHKDIIERVKTQFSTPSEAAANEDFLKDLQEVLIAWKIGNGRKGVRLVDCKEFDCQIKKAAKQLDNLRDYRIESLTDAEIPSVKGLLWKTIDDLKITTAEARIVSGTKAIHHLVPDLIPPMDNRFTGGFFLGYGIGQSGRPVFSKLYANFVYLARCFAENEEFMKQVGCGFNTSIPKTLDNAIIGFINPQK